MKRCPECRRDYYDDSLLYCLDDGAALLEGPATGGFEPATAILHDVSGQHGGEFPAAVRASDDTAILRPGDNRIRGKSFDKRLLAGPLVLGVVLLGAFFAYRYVSSGAKEIDSIAVLPFVNETGDPDHDYLTDGMTETFINSLSQVPNLSVKARSSVFRYKNDQGDLKKVAAELGVQCILTGRISQRGEQIVLKLELVDPAAENVLLGRNYERRTSDLASLHSEAARDISNKLRSRMTPDDERKMARDMVDNAEAYHLYLKGHFYLDKQTESGYRQAIDYFNQAVEREPNYALAYAGLAQAHIGLGIDYSKPKDVFPLAKLFARRALELSPDLIDAQAALGSTSFFFDWDWAAADRELKRAIELSAQSTEPYGCTLHYLDAAGHPDDAVTTVRRVAQHHPTSIVINGEIGCSSYYARRYDEAITDLRKTIEMDPTFAPAYYNLGRAYGQKAMFKDALAALGTARTLSADTPYVVSELGYALAASGDRAGADEILRGLKQQGATRHIDAYLLAIIHMGLGDTEKTFSELERAFQERSTSLVWLKAEPKFATLHADPRFAAMLKRMNLPE